MAAYFSQRRARTNSTKANWQTAAEKLSLAYTISNNSTMRTYLVAGAIRAYEHLQRFEPDNLDTQIRLARATLTVRAAIRRKSCKG